jgi:integrase
VVPGPGYHQPESVPAGQLSWASLGRRHDREGGVREKGWHRSSCTVRPAQLCQDRHSRRTCARLCRLAGGELDQIQFLLGHVSIQTTERYLGCKQKLRCAVNDRIGIEPEDAQSP